MTKTIVIDDTILKEVEEKCDKLGKSLDELIYEMMKDFVGSDAPRSLDIDEMTYDEICADIDRGIEDIRNGRYMSLDEMERRFREGHPA